MITCLHTVDSNIAVFEEAAQELGISLSDLFHEVRSDLLVRAEQAGGLTDEIATETASMLQTLSHKADAVVLTCSTLGPSIDRINGKTMGPILRVDAALAEQSVAAGGIIVALCAVETTLEPTTRLFARAAERSQTLFDVRIVPGAWARFKAGDRDGYLSMIAEAADASYREGATTVALAQASMAGAANLVTEGPKPLTSPVAGLAAAVKMAFRDR